MARRFTLAQMMAGLTLFCVFCGILVNFFVPVVSLALFALFLTPTVLVTFGLSYYYEERDALAWRVALGAILGLFFGPDIALSPALGILFLGLPPILIRSFRGPHATHDAQSSRTFSLASLMFVITLVCVVCGVATQGPGDFLLVIPLFLPTALVCLVLIRFAQWQTTVMIIALIGALFSIWFFVRAAMSPLPPTASEIIWRDFSYLFIYAPLGSLLLGGAVLADEIWKRRKSALAASLESQHEQTDFKTVLSQLLK